MPPEEHRQMFNDVCEPRFNQMTKWQEDHDTTAKRRSDRIEGKLDSLMTKLFIGNGGKAWDVRLATVEGKTRDLLGKWKWICGVGTMITIGVLIKIIYDIIRHAE